MAVTDAYCRVNRARGLELLSPEDFLQSCRLMKELNLPVKLREYDSGVLVLQLQSQSDAELDKETFKLVMTHLIALVAERNSFLPSHSLNS